MITDMIQTLIYGAAAASIIAALVLRRNCDIYQDILNDLYVAIHMIMKGDNNHDKH